MFDILAGFQRTKDWALALEEIIPKRKGVHKKDGAQSSGEEEDASHDQSSVNQPAHSVKDTGSVNNNTNTM